MAKRRHPQKTLSEKKNAKNFIEIVAIFFEDLLRSFYYEIKKGSVEVHCKYSYPTYLRVAESPSHYIAELCGFQEMTSPNSYRIERKNYTENVVNASSFINPGFDVDNNQESLIKITGSRNSFSGGIFCTQYDKEQFERYINIPIRSLGFYAGSDFYPKVPIIISAEADKILFRDVQLIRTQNLRIFYRKISTAIIVKKIIQEMVLREWLIEVSNNAWRTNDLIGLNIDYSPSVEAFAVELLSLTHQNVKEPQIDTFIGKHSDYFAKALGRKEALPKVELKIINNKIWQDKDCLIPDYLLLRDDGYYDILDLKQALKCKRITKGKKPRYSFNDYVTKLIAQLRDYERYFEIEEHVEWVLNNKGIKIKNPRLIGVVGNHYNFIREDVDLARETIKNKIVILSYSEIVDLSSNRIQANDLGL